MTITLYHNPCCSKSRQTLALLEQQGIKPEIVLYLETPPSAQDLKSLLGKLGYAPRQLLRQGEDQYQSLRLARAELSDEELIQAMVEHPILIERPIVINGAKAALGRPPEQILDIL